MATGSAVEWIGDSLLTGLPYATEENFNLVANVMDVVVDDDAHVRFL